jgi:hypothetical protein
MITMPSRRFNKIAAGPVPSLNISASAALPELEPRPAGKSNMRPLTHFPN